MSGKKTAAAVNWLTGVELEAMVARNANQVTRAAFLGVFAVNTLPKNIGSRPVLLIVNSDTSNLAGKHWYAIHIDSKHHGELFDPLAGVMPVSPFLEFWLNGKTVKWTCNDIPIQHPLIPSCGAFALHFILNRLQFATMKSYILRYFVHHNDNHSFVKNELFIRCYVDSLIE